MYGAYVIRATFVRHATFQPALCKKLLFRICFFYRFFFFKFTERWLVFWFCGIYEYKKLHLQHPEPLAHSSTAISHPLIKFTYFQPIRPSRTNSLNRPPRGRAGGESSCNPRRKRKLISDLLELELNMTRGAGSLTRLDRSLLQI